MKKTTKEVIHLLDFLLGYGVLNVDNGIASAKLRVESLSQSKQGTTLKGKLPNNTGDWSIDFGHKKDSLIPYLLHLAHRSSRGWWLDWRH